MARSGPRKSESLQRAVQGDSRSNMERIPLFLPAVMPAERVARAALLA